MKLLLHPGHSKCGSTTIQKAIIKNRKLLEAHGYVIPDPQMRIRGDDGFNPNGETPRAFFRHAMEQKDLGPLKEKLARLKQKHGDSDSTVLISAENLVNQLGAASGLNIHRLLRDTFDSHEVIYYIRRQDQFIMSAWQQWGYKKGLSLQAFVEQALKTRNPNYRVIASAFSNLYGKTNVTVVPLLRESLIEGDLVSDFFARLGIRDKVQKPADSIDNKSLNPYLCEALSRVNHIFRDIHDESVKHQLEQSHSSNPALYMRDNNYMSAKTRKRIYDAFSEDNRFIADNHETGDVWYEFSEPMSKPEEQVRSAEKGAQRILNNLEKCTSLGMSNVGKIKKNIEVYPERRRTLPTSFPIDHMLVSQNLQEIEPAVRVLHLAYADVCLKPSKAFSLNGNSIKALSTPAVEHYLHKRSGSLQVLSGRILDLTTPGSNLYSHWLLDLLPKIKAVTEAGYDITRDFDKIIVNFYGSRFKRESFKLLGIDDAIVSDYTNHLKCFTAKDIVSVTPCRRALFTPQWIAEFVRSIFYSTQPIEFSKKVYISRSKGNTRRILNEARFVEEIAALGYKTYYCEDHTIAETAAIMRNATDVIAPHGAGLANLVFAKPSTQVTELFCAHLSSEFYKLSTINGLKYRPVQVLSGDNEFVNIANMNYENDRAFYHKMNMIVPDGIMKLM